MKRLHRKPVLALLVIAALIGVGAVAVAKSVRYPTYFYYGKVLTVEERLAQVESGAFTICTEIPSAERYLDELSTNVDYICFDTEKEMDAYVNAVIRPEYERLAKSYPNVERAVPADATENSSEILRQSSH